MIDIDVLFSIIIWLLCSILLITLIILIIKLIKTIGKVDKVIDDVSEKSSKLDGVFNLVDSTTDALSTVGDKMINFIITFISNLVTKKRKEENKNE